MYTVFLSSSSRRWRQALAFFKEHDVDMNIVDMNEHFFPYHHFLHIISHVGLEAILKRTSKNEPGVWNQEFFQEMTLRQSYEFLKENRRWVRDYIFYSEDNVIVGITDDDLTCFLPKEKKLQARKNILKTLEPASHYNGEAV